MWVVNNEDIRAFTSNSATNTNSEIVTTVVSVPTTSSLRIRLKLDTREYFLVNIRVNEVPHFTTEAHSQFSGVRCLNHFLLRILPQEPTWQQVRRKLRFCMTRWHINNESFALPTRHALERVGQRVVPFDQGLRLLEIARALKTRKDLPFTYELLFLDGEEAVIEWQGTDNTYGSRFYVQAAQKAGITKTLRANVLVDMIGAKDLAFPKLNLASWYIYMIGAAFTTYAVVAGGLDTGWTFYTPFSTVSSTSAVVPAAVGIFIAGFSSILTGLNFMVTIHRMRAPGLTWFRLPLFVWALYATSLIQVLGTPVVAITIVLVAAERKVEDGGNRDRIVEAFGSAGRGGAAGDPVLQVAHRDRHAGEAGQDGGAFQARAREKDVGAWTTVQSAIEEPEQEQAVVGAQVVCPRHRMATMPWRETKVSSSFLHP